MSDGASIVSMCSDIFSCRCGYIYMFPIPHGKIVGIINDEVVPRQDASTMIPDPNDSYQVNPKTYLGDIDNLIEVLYKVINKYPEDYEFQQLLDDTYKRVRDPGLTVRGWEQLWKNHPQSARFDQRLASAYINRKDPVKMISDFMDLLDTQSESTDFQNHLFHAYSNVHDPYQTIEGWSQLIKRYPKYLTLVDRLAEALMFVDDTDYAMAIWWELLKANPMMTPILREFWNACHGRRGRKSEFGSFITAEIYWQLI
jgi:tetratricopeptide (TPR) repeat protein